MDIAIVGNFSTTYQEASGYYTKTGTWFDFFSGASVNVTDLLTRDLLAPGEFHIYTTVRQPALEPGLVNFVVTDVPDKAGFSSVVYPNPSNGKIWVRIPDSQLATEVQLLSTTGARISSEAAAPGQQDVYLDATTLPKGIYLIRVEGAHREVHKVVIH